MQEVFCYVIYKLKPVISITLGGGWGGDHTTFRGYWGGVSCRQHSIKGDYIKKITCQLTANEGGGVGRRSNEYHRASCGDQVKFIVTQNATPSPPPRPPRLSIMTARFVKEFNLFLFKGFSLYAVPGSSNCCHRAWPTVWKAIPTKRATVEDCSFKGSWRLMWDYVSGELRYRIYCA